MKFLLSLVFCFAVVIEISAQSQESKIMSLFIFKFIENVSWPDDRKNLVIGAIGKSEVMEEVAERLKVKNPSNMKIRQITVQEAATCDVIFVPTSENKSMAALQQATNGKPILVVTQSDMSTRGSGISFILESGRLNFIVNLATIETNGLKVSRALLSLGRQS